MREPRPRPPCPDCGSRQAERVGWDQDHDAPGFHCVRCGKLWSVSQGTDDGGHDA